MNVMDANEADNVKGGSDMANEQNLKPIRDSQRARELQVKAAKKQRENIARRKTFKEALLVMLSEENTQSDILNALLKKAMKGDTKAFEVIRDSIGEKEPERQEVKADTDFNVNIKVIK